MTASPRTARRELRRRRLRAAIASGRISSPLVPRLLPVTWPPTDGCGHTELVVGDDVSGTGDRR